MGVRAVLVVVSLVGCARHTAVPCNGVLESGEICDDGNSSDGDGCDCATRAIPNAEQPIIAGTPRVLVEDGAWCWFQDERVILDGDRVVAATISHGGDIQVSSLVPATGELTHSLLYTRLERDDHDVPSLLPLADGRIAAYFTRHDGFPHLYTLITERAGSVTEWGTKYRTSFDYDVTYTNPFLLDDRPDRVLMFIRGKETNPTLIVSTNEGRSWSDGSQLMNAGERDLTGRVFDHRPYVKLATDGETIHMLYTDGHPIEYRRNSIYHLAFRDGSLLRSDGTRIAAAHDEPLLAPSAGTLVYDGRVLPGGQAWTWDAAIDPQGRPVSVFSTFPDPARPFFAHRYQYAAWDGERWQVHLIAHAGTGIYEAEGFYSGGITLDPDDPRIVYFSSNVDPISGEPTATGVFEIYRGVTSDAGATWTITAVTSQSRVSNLRPIVPAHHVEPTTLLWMRGSYDTYLDYHTQIVALTGDAGAVASPTTSLQQGLVTLARFDLAATVNGPATPTTPGFVPAVPLGGFAQAESNGISLLVSNITATREAVTADPLYRGLVVCERGGYDPDDKLRVELSGLTPGREYIVRLHGHDTAGAYTKPTLWFRGDARTLDSDHDNAAYVTGHRNVNNTVAGEGQTDVVLRADDRGAISIVGRGLDYAGDDRAAILSAIEVLEVPVTTLLARFDVDAEPGVNTAPDAVSLSFDDATEWSGEATAAGVTVRVTTDRIDALRRRESTDPMLGDFVYGRDQLVVDVSGLEPGRLYAFTVYSTDVQYNRYAATRWRIEEPSHEPLVVHGFHMNQHRTDDGAGFTFFHRANATSFRLRGEDVITSLSTNPSLVIFNGIDVEVAP